MNIRRWLDPANMPKWWFWTSAILAGAFWGTALFLLLVAIL